MKRPIEGAPKADPVAAPDWDMADAGAFQALARGDAAPHLQKRALQWLIAQAAGTYDLSFRPGADGDRATAFAEGRRFVGLQVVKLLNVNIDRLKKDDN